MASKMSSGDLKSLCECPVCFEPFRNPRLLTCGHQFCECCLKDIVRHNTQSHIACPSCRVVTKPQNGDVATLPRSTLYQYIHEFIFQQPTEEALGQKCTKCKVNEPTRHCPECTFELSYLCDKCYSVHQKVARFTKHNTVQFDPLLVCSNHSHRMVENFCYNCKEVACVDCLFDKHPDHETEYLDKAAAQSRNTLKEYVVKHKQNIIDTNILDKLKNASEKLEKKKTTVQLNAERMKKAINRLEINIDRWVIETTDTINNELKKMSGHQTKIAEVISAQDKMLQLAESLLGPVSDPQVVMGSLDLPYPDIDITQVEINMPVDHSLDTLIDDINKLSQSVSTTFQKEVYRIHRGINTTNHHNEGTCTCLICMDTITNIRTLPCKHTFCKDCIGPWFKQKPSCPNCGEIFGPMTGNQPDGTMTHCSFRSKLLGYEWDSSGTIEINYNFPSGIQKENHPNPGVHYKGDRRTAYLPDNPEGRDILRLLEIAFKSKILFTIGRSVTTGREDRITWNDVHHKTKQTGGASKFGYPDDTYLKRVREELAAKGVK